MKRMFAIFALAAAMPAQAQVIDVKQDLEAKLREKPPLNYGEIKAQRYKRCEPNKSSDGRICRSETVMVDRRYEAPAKVDATNVIEIKDFKFLPDKRVDLPRDVIIKKVPVYYCVTGNYSNSIGETIQGTQSYQFVKSRSVATTRGISVTATAKFSEMYSGGSTVNFSETLTVGTQATDARSETVTRSMTQTVSFQGPQAVEIAVFAYQYTVDLPYSGMVVVDADIARNNSGIIKASQLLSEAERSFPIEGKLRVSGVSNAEYRAFPIKDGCSAVDKAGTETTGSGEQYITTPALAPELSSATPAAAKALGEALASEQVMKSAMPETMASRSKAALIHDDQVIGPPDGISYRVIFTRKESRADPTCGFTDLGFAKARDYEIEQREYQEARGGRIVRTWMENFERAGMCSIWDQPAQPKSRPSPVKRSSADRAKAGV